MTRIRTSNAVILQARKLAQTITESKADRANKDRVVLWCRASRLPEPDLEVQFSEFRKWRADYLWADAKIILEKEGGIFQGGTRGGSKLGGHSSGLGILRDIEKSNAAQLLGYLYLRATPRDIENGSALTMIAEALKGRSCHA
jgi:hypothetical protein